MTKKKIVSLSLVIALLATLVIGGTLAYFTDTDDATNTFTVGNVEIDLTEPDWDASGATDAPTVYPGEALAKDPTVENKGANPCFVRIKVTGLDSLKNAGLSEQDIALRNVDTAHWTYNEEDGYYYYKGILAAGQKVEDLFTHIVMPTDLNNETVKDTPYNVVVKAEAVQAQGARASFEAVKAMTVSEIADWFETVYNAEGITL